MFVPTQPVLVSYQNKLKLIVFPQLFSISVAKENHKCTIYQRNNLTTGETKSVRDSHETIRQQGKLKVSEILMKQSDKKEN